MGACIQELFFVKRTKPRLVIGLVSVAFGIAVDLMLVGWTRSDEAFFLNRFNCLADIIIRFVACISATVILAFTICGIYNFCIRHIWKT